MNTEIKSAEEIFKEWRNKFEEVPQYLRVSYPHNWYVINAMEEYHAQFKQPDISEDVRKAAEKYLTDLGIANTGMFTSRTMLKTFEAGAEWQSKQPIPTVDEDEDIYDSVYMEVVELVEKDNIQNEFYKETAEKLKKHFSITRK